MVKFRVGLVDGTASRVWGKHLTPVHKHKPCVMHADAARRRVSPRLRPPSKKNSCLRCWGPFVGLMMFMCCAPRRQAGPSCISRLRTGTPLLRRYRSWQLKPPTRMRLEPSPRPLTVCKSLGLSKGVSELLNVADRFEAFSSKFELP